MDIPEFKAHHVNVLGDVRPSLETAASECFLVHLAVGRRVSVTDGIKTGRETPSTRRETSPSATLSTGNSTWTVLGENMKILLLISYHRATNIVTKRASANTIEERPS
jgi:hypothetical protein